MHWRVYLNALKRYPRARVPVEEMCCCVTCHASVLGSALRAGRVVSRVHQALPEFTPMCQRHHPSHWEEGDGEGGRILAAGELKEGRDLVSWEVKEGEILVAGEGEEGEIMVAGEEEEGRILMGRDSLTFKVAQGCHSCRHGLGHRARLC